MMEWYDSAFQTLEGALNFATLKNRTIANNIANVDTPDFKAKGVRFKKILHQTLESKRTHPRHNEYSSEDTSQKYQTYTKQKTTYNHKGNNVDIDKEKSELAKNQIYYKGLVDRINRKFNNHETVIRGGK